MKFVNAESVRFTLQIALQIMTKGSMLESGNIATKAYTLNVKNIFPIQKRFISILIPFQKFDCIDFG